MRQWKRWGMTLLMVLTVGLIVSCQDTSPTVRDVSGDCTPVDHAAGNTCVPNAFERLVTLDSVAFENAIALGIQPTAAVFSNLSSHLQDHFEGIERIGLQGENPNLETVLSTAPDLILGLDSHQSIYPQASQIAPTVLFEFEHSGRWKEVFQSIAETLDKTDIWQQVMDDYNQRLEEFKARMGDRRPKVSVARIYPDSINLYLRDSFPGNVLQDAGLARPNSQNLSATEARSFANNPIQMSISREVLDQIDGDILFVWTAENEPKANQEAQEKLEQLKNDPLWKTLSVVQKNQVYFVPSYWIGSGPIAANAILNDLFKYLLETPNP